MNPITILVRATRSCKQQSSTIVVPSINHFLPKQHHHQNNNIQQRQQQLSSSPTKATVGNNSQKVISIKFRNLSTSTKNEQEEGFFSRWQSKFSSPKEKKNEHDALYEEQFQEMAKESEWTLNHVSQQISKSIKASTSGWRSMIPGMSNVGALKQLKDEQKLVNAAIVVLGNNVGLERVKNMDRKEKLKISLESKADPSQVNVLIDNYESITIMHRMLRHRVRNELPVPKNEREAKDMMSIENVRKVLSTKEIKNLQRKNMKLKSGKMKT